MGFVESIRTCLAKYVTFSGRARRPEYWWFILFGTLAGLAGGVLDLLFGIGDVDGGPIGTLASLAVFLPTLAVTWRRMHDVAKPGWYAFLPLVGLLPLVAATGVAAMQGGPGGALMQGLMMLGGLAAAAAGIYLFVLLVSRGTAGPNSFGPEPAV